MIKKILVLSALIICSGCSKAAMSDARLNHLLAGDHGWIDLTVKTPQGPEKGPNANECSITFLVNGEPFVRESANFATANSSGSPIGYRFPAPSGQLDVELMYSLCSEKPVAVKERLSLLKDHLTEVSFDGHRLIIEGSSEYNPASLDRIHSQLETVRNDAANTDQHLSTTNYLVVLCLVLNGVSLVILLWRRRRAP